MNIAVIGGGMAGLCAAIKCAENKDNKVTIYERQEKPGKKILMTGNGRCNLTNTDADDLSKYVTNNAESLGRLYKNTSFMDAIDFFETYGLFIRAKEGGIYPFSNKASSVRDVLILAAENNNVRIINDTYIDNITPKKDKFTINSDIYDKVILACGGKAGVYKEQEYNGYKITKTLDINYEFFSPGLCGIKCEGDFSLLNKSRAEARVTLMSNSTDPVSDEGEIQFTDYGLSGIPIFNLSLYTDKNVIDGGAYILADFLPFMSEIETKGLFAYKKNAGLDLFKGLFTDELANYLAKDLDINDTEAVVKAVKYQRFNITGLKEYKSAQVMKGGISLSEINENYESVKYPGLYITGEMLDVTGHCGGFNINFAVVSALKAGRDINK